MFICGTVEAVQYRKETYYVLRVKPEGQKSTIVMAGDVIGPALYPGAWIGARGKYKMHKKYGKQFEIEIAPVTKGWSDEQICKLLEARAYTASTTFEIRMAARKQRMDIADFIEDYDTVQNAMGPKFDTTMLQDTWRGIKSLFLCIPQLEKMGFKAKQINRMYRALGDDITELSDNPWMLTKAGFSFEKADKLATAMGLDRPNLRIRSALTEVVKRSAQSGSTCIGLQDALTEVRKLVGSVSIDKLQVSALSVSNIGNARANDVIWDNKSKTFALARLLWAERRSAASLRHRSIQSSPFITFCKEKKIEKPAEYAKDLIQKSADLLGLTLSTEQESAIFNAIISPITIISGLPGTGKTTSLRVLVQTLQEMGFWTIPPSDLATKGKSKITPSQIRLMAPTGIAAKRMKEVTGVDAYTIHLALGGRPGGSDEEADDVDYTGIKERSENDVLEGGIWNTKASEANEYIKFLIIDESSMMDITLLDIILKKVPENVSIIFIGDHCQLPSVGPGNVLRDLIRTERFPTVHLTQIFRQGEQSKIVTAAHAIVNGKNPEFEGDFKLIRCINESQALHSIKHIAKKLYSMRRNFQILSPRHAGTVGVTNLNAELRELLNPPSIATKQIKIMTGYVREGDRVMITRNRYDLNVYNGDVGKVVSIDLKENLISVKIHDTSNRIVILSVEDASVMLRLSYAQTVHKSQGQEYDIIVMPVLRTFGRQLQRNLLYTGITRAKKTVLLVGEDGAVYKAVANDKEGNRLTQLVESLS